MRAMAVSSRACTRSGAQDLRNMKNMKATKLLALAGLALLGACARYQAPPLLPPPTASVASLPISNHYGLRGHTPMDAPTPYALLGNN